MKLLTFRSRKSSDGEEISATLTKLAYRKVADVKTCQSPYDIVTFIVM